MSTRDLTDLLFRPATELAGLVRSGEVSARELAETSLARIDEVDGRVNAFTLVDADGALAAADAISAGDERPFAGVPIAIKDLFAPVAGLVMSQGSELFGDYAPDYDGYVVRRFREAGFVIMGKTSSPELGIIPVTEPRRFGPTRNPWNLERTPGGSSGGSAAAVAAGMVPIAHGSDGGGSIRIPSACCGLVGLKPSRGRISRGPDLGDSFLATDGALTRTVEDSARALDVMAGYEPGDATWAPPPAEPFANAVGRDPGRLRIALVTKPPIDAQIDPICERAVRDAAELLAGLGHEVTEADPPWGREGDAHMLALFTVLYAANIGLGVAFGGMVSGSEPTPDRVEKLTWEMFQRGLGQSSIEYMAAMSQLQRYSRELIEWSSSYDMLMTPALAQRPLEIGDIKPDGENPLAEFARTGVFTPFTAVFNVTGQPAISLPLFQGEDGMPAAVQFAGKPLDEAGLLTLAAQLEAETRWPERRAEL
ncbi:MAG TPA: amidase [Thermoleophilaceae bacterium]